MGKGSLYFGNPEPENELKTRPFVRLPPQRRRAFFMENWPLNGKSLWKSLRPGQRWAAIIGVPINLLLFKAYLGFVSQIGIKVVEVFLYFLGFFIIPWIYAAGLGLVIGVIIEVLFYRRR